MGFTDFLEDVWHDVESVATTVYEDVSSLVHQGADFGEESLGGALGAMEAPLQGIGDILPMLAIGGIAFMLMMANSGGAERVLVAGVNAAGSAARIA